MKRSIEALGKAIFVCSMALMGAWQAGAQRIDPLDENQAKQNRYSKIQQRILADQLSEACVQTDLSRVPVKRPEAGTVIYAYDPVAGQIVSFDASAPETYLTTVPVSGLEGDELLYGIDFRPLDGVLYGLVTSGFPTRGRVVKINLTTGAVTSVHPTNTIATSVDIFHGYDINASDGQLRQVGDMGTNRRMILDTGTVVANNATLRYVAGDINAGVSPRIVHTANAVSSGSSPKYYGIDSAANTLVRIGAVDGNPSPGSTGDLSTVGGLGLNPTSFGAMDIQPGSNTAYAALNIDSVPTFVSIDLTTGAATIIGPIGSAIVIDGIAIQTGAIVAPSPVPSPTPGVTPTPGATATPTPTPTPTPPAPPTPTPSVTPTPIPPNASIIRAVSTQTAFNMAVHLHFDLLARGGEKRVMFSFAFNQSVFLNPVVSLSPQAQVGSTLTTDMSEAAQGRIGIIIDSPAAYPTGTHRLVTVVFHTSQTAPAGAYPISYVATPIPFEIRDVNGNLLPWWFERGVIVSTTSSAGVEVSGRVLTADGRGLRNARVSIVDASGGRRTVTTGSFGNYRFDDIEAGGTYVVTVDSKRYSFAPRVLAVADTLTDVNFLAN